MPKYLFTSDQRISVLPSSIQRVAQHISSGKSLSEFTDKSDNNNATTLRAYYNLYEGTETCQKAAENPSYAIRNFVLKFQFPNVRTPESLADSIQEHTLLAPFRAVVSTLVRMAQCSSDGTSVITYDEILYYIFCNPKVYRCPNFDTSRLISDIENGRNAGLDLQTHIANIIEWNQYGRQIGELMSVLFYASGAFIKNGRAISFSLNSTAYQEDKSYIDSILEYDLLWYPSDYKDFNKSTKEYISYMDTVHTPYNVVDINTLDPVQEPETPNDEEIGYNMIFYGAPGTGKSHTVNEDYVKKDKCFRITFHPDTDYASFVGAYKPTMGGENEDEISYSFVAQVFLNAYVYAWNNPGKKTFLVIEELNRGNCAQIFGDVFQLLDRQLDKNPGFSKYTINADADISCYLKKKIANQEGFYENTIKTIYNLDEFDYSVMAIPSNLFILATMNTSDQSLFPIDSAFKRRWKMKYVPVSYSDASQFTLEIDDKHSFNWAKVLAGLNSFIKSETDSTNKILGNRFVQADANNVIDMEAFRDKVLFFLFNDVFKDNDDFAQAFFGESDSNKFFEDLCETKDNTLVINFLQDICKAENLKKPDSTQNEESSIEA